MRPGDQNVILYLFAEGIYDMNVVGTMRLRDNMAIVGGWKLIYGGARPHVGKTNFMHGRVFYNNSVGPPKAVLYGVWISNAYNYGMVNESSSPTVSSVTFSGNTRGLYEINSSGVYTNFTFSSNKTEEGPGAYIEAASRTLSLSTAPLPTMRRRAMAAR